MTCFAPFKTGIFSSPFCRFHWIDDHDHQKDDYIDQNIAHLYCRLFYIVYKMFKKRIWFLDYLKL